MISSRGIEILVESKMMAEDLEIKIGPKSGKREVLLICLGLILVTATAFEPVRHNDFVRYDDNTYLVTNQYVQEGVTRDSVVWAFTTFHMSNWHPLTWISHMVDCGLFGLEPVWHHFVNVLFHICNSLLLFIVLRRTTRAVWRSAVVAALFAIHPIHVESVAWAAERKDVLSTFFWLLTMLAYVDYAKKLGIWRYVVVFVMFCFGLMAKPMLVTLPVVLLLFDFWPLGRLRYAGGDKINHDGCEKVGLWKLIFEKIPFFTIACCSAVVTIIAQRKAMEVGEDEISGLLMKVGNAQFSYLAYLGKMLYPKDLAVLYPLGIEELGLWKPLFALVVLLLITSAVLYARRERGWLVMGWLWYLITLLPVIGLIQVGVQAMADRYTYVPSIGFFLMVVWGLAELFERFKVRAFIRVTLSVGVLVVCVLVTRVQVGYWRNSFTLFGRAIDVTENNYVMHNNVGAVFFDHGKFDEAVEHFKKALRIKPDFILTKINIGYLLRRQNKMDEAIECFKEVLSVKKDSPKVYNELGMAYAYKGEYELAIECYKRAIELKADNPYAYNNWGTALKDQGKTDEAREKFNKARQLQQQQGDETEMMLLNENEGVDKVADNDE